MSMEGKQDLIDKGKAIEQNRILGILIDAEARFTDSSRIVKYISGRIQDE